MYGDPRTRYAIASDLRSRARDFPRRSVSRNLLTESALARVAGRAAGKTRAGTHRAKWGRASRKSLSAAGGLSSKVIIFGTRCISRDHGARRIEVLHTRSRRGICSRYDRVDFCSKIDAPINYR